MPSPARQTKIRSSGSPEQSRPRRPRSWLRDGVPPACVFFFEGYGDHRDLHSFPTRRSSDPSRPPIAVLVRLIGVTDHAYDDGDIGPYLMTPDRSEEHTSELQSRGHLVCR